MRNYITGLRAIDAIDASKIAANSMQNAMNAELEQIPLDHLIPYPRNPRTHPKPNVQKLAASLTEYGWTSPVLITDELEIIAGHGRVLAAKELKIATAPCIRLSHLTAEQVQAYRLADNRLALDSDWDLELLKLELGEIDLDNLLTGFDPDEIDRILNSDAAREGEDDAPELQETAVSAPGEIWALGAHRLLCGDACDKEAVESLLAGVTPSVMVTDPPYGVEYDAAWRSSLDDWNRATGLVNNDNVSDWRAAYSCFKGNVAYIWHAGLHANIVSDGLKECGFTLRSQIIWVKPHFVISRGDYHVQHEPCFYAVRKGAKGNYLGDRTQSTVWQIANALWQGGPATTENEKSGHGTQKPVECMRRPIVNHTSPGQAAYDPFMGSGTTIIAAETIGRVCYGVEINPLYVDMAIRRWQTFTGKTATRLSDGKPFDG